MDDHRFDRFTRAMAGASSRRSVLKSLAASGAASVSALVLGRASQARTTAVPATPLANLDPEEQAIAFYEQLTDIADQHAAEGCDTIAKLTQQFLADRADILAKIRAEDATWSKDQREAYGAKYGDRLDEATRKAHFAREWCRYADGAAGTPVASPQAVGGSSVALMGAMPLAFADGGSNPALTRAAPLLPAARTAQVGISAGCGGEGCADHCPLDRTECIETWGSCIAGDDCDCCLSSLCGSKSHCLLDCNSNDCCGNLPACTSAPVPPPRRKGRDADACQGMKRDHADPRDR